MRYIELKKQLKTLSNCKVISMGKTMLGKELYVICIKGTTTSSVIIQCAMHAREHITCDLIINLLNKYNGEFIPNIYIIPLVNPDGVEICESGRYNYKANSRGVDINNNFNAKWNSCEFYSPFPCAGGYAGTCYESEAETQALVKFTNKIKPILTISLHTKGEEIYYDFYNVNKKRDKKIAQLFAHNLKYKIVSTEKNSAGGYKDWCIEKLGITALTIECGSDKLSHPLSRNIEVLPLLENKFKDLFRLINKSVVIINGNK